MSGAHREGDAGHQARYELRKQLLGVYATESPDTVESWETWANALTKFREKNIPPGDATGLEA